MPNRDNRNQWIQADLQTIHRIESVTTQGNRLSTHCPACWVTAYFVSYSQDGTSWVKISTLFMANEDTTTKRTNRLPDNINARFIRLSPETRKVFICMRFDVTGCAVTGTMPLYTLVTVMSFL